MEKQEIFDRIVNHLLTQKEKAMIDLNTCAYRIPGSDMKCAIGVLIPDSAYIPDIENLAVRDVYYCFPDVLTNSGIRVDCVDMLDFLQEAQNIHDDVEVRCWERSLQKMAVKYKLEFNWKG